jgi:hypothetical protein
MSHLCHPMPSHVTLLVSVRYDDITIGAYERGISKHREHCNAASGVRQEADGICVFNQEAKASAEFPNVWASASPGEPFGIFYVLSLESENETEEWVHALRPAARFQGTTIAMARYSPH